MIKNPSIKNKAEKSSSFIYFGSNSDLAYTAAKVFAKDSGISEFDTVEIEPQEGGKNSKGEISIKAVREMIRQINLTPGHGSGKLAIIKGADRLGLEAANTLLKTLEEPPKNVTIILLSSDLKLLPTIRSRCQIIRFADKIAEADQLAFDEFREAAGGNLTKAFSAAEKMSTDIDLDRKFEVIICQLRDRMIKNDSIDYVKKIKALFAAKKILGLTTNKRLVLENLFLELYPVKSDKIGSQGEI